MLIRCRHCGESYIVPISEQKYLNWIKKGTFVQDEFPELNPNERELLISQTCDNCWNKIFNIDEIQSNEWFTIISF